MRFYHDPTFEEAAKYMLINAEILMKRISEHADKEIERLKTTLHLLSPDTID